MEAPFDGLLPLANQSRSSNLHSNGFPDLAAFWQHLQFFSERKKEKITGCVGWLLVRRVCAASKKQEQYIKQTTERCFVIEKVFSFKERAERIGKY